MSTTKTTQERAEIDAASEPAAVDCRKCVHGYDIREGVSVTCAIRARSSGTTPVPWDDVADGVCSDWRERPASPPVSADREGPDALDAMRLAVTALEHDVPGECWATGPNTGDPVEDLVVCPGCRALATLRRAIAAEEARRARPAQWSHVWRCSGCGEMRPEQGVVDSRWLWNGSVWDHQCDASHREPARDFGPAVEDPHRAAGRDLFHAVAALDRMFETDPEMTHEQRVAVYRQAYLAQEAWLALDPEAQTAPTRPAVEDPRDAEIAKLRAELDALRSRHLPLSLRQDPSDETIRDWYERTNKYEDGLRVLLGQCATALRQSHDAETIAATGNEKRRAWHARVDALAACRVAGVEPTP